MKFNKKAVKEITLEGGEMAAEMEEAKWPS